MTSPWDMGKYIQDLHDSENCPREIVIEGEKELDKDYKEPAILKSDLRGSVSK